MRVRFPPPPPVPHLLACHDCDLLQRRVHLAEGEAARCRRCGATLYARRRHARERALALTLASLVLFALANLYPFMSFERDGLVQVTTIAGGAARLFDTGMPLLAGLVLFMAVAAPIADIGGLLLVLAFSGSRRSAAVRRGPRWPLVVRVLELLRPWSMLEIFLLGALVALVKLRDYATIEVGVAFWAFAALVLTTAGAAAHLDPEDLFAEADA